MGGVNVGRIVYHIRFEAYGSGRWWRGGGTVSWPKKHRKYWAPKKENCYKAPKAPKLIYTVMLRYSFVRPPPPEGGGLAQGLGIYLFAFGSAYWPLTTAHSDPLWARTCFGCVNGAPG